MIWVRQLNIRIPYQQCQIRFLVKRDTQNENLSQKIALSHVAHYKRMKTSIQIPKQFKHKYFMFCILACTKDKVICIGWARVQGKTSKQQMYSLEGVQNQTGYLILQVDYMNQINPSQQKISELRECPEASYLAPKEEWKPNQKSVSPHSSEHHQSERNQIEHKQDIENTFQGISLKTSHKNDNGRLNLESMSKRLRDNDSISQKDLQIEILNQGLKNQQYKNIILENDLFQCRLKEELRALGIQNV